MGVLIWLHRYRRAVCLLLCLLVGTAVVAHVWHTPTTSVAAAAATTGPVAEAVMGDEAGIMARKEGCQDIPAHASGLKVTLLNQQWHVAQGPTSRFMVRSAFLDTRSTNGAYVRVFAITTALPGNSKVVCVFWDADGNRLGRGVSASEKEYGRGASVDGIRYQEVLFSCPAGRDGDPMPSQVSLGHGCVPFTTLLPVRVPSPQPEVDIGVCVPVLYGRVNATVLVEWIELNRLLGITEFNFYLSRPNKAAEEVLQYYAESGIVRMSDVTPPVPVTETWCYWCQKLAVIPTLNECLYENMFRYKFLLSIDIDEFVIPRQNANLMDMIRSVDPNHECNGYEFQNAYFFLDFGANSPIKGANSLMNGPNSPMNGPNSPIKGANSLMNEPNSPMNGPNSPMNGPNSPMNGLNSPMNGPNSPMNGPKSPIYDPNSPVDTSLQELRTLTQLQRTDLSPLGYASKMLLDPLRCIVLQNHNCLEWLPLEDWTIVPVWRRSAEIPSSIALLHHYKFCHLGEKECETARSKLLRDDFALKFSSQLSRNYKVHMIAVRSRASQIMFNGS